MILGSGPSPFDATHQPSSGPPKAADLRANPLADKDGGLVVDRSSGELASSRSETPPSRQASSPPTSRSHTPTSSALFSVEEVEEKVWSQESAAAPTEPAVEDQDADLMQELHGANPNPSPSPSPSPNPDPSPSPSPSPNPNPNPKQELYGAMEEQLRLSEASRPRWVNADAMRVSAQATKPRSEYAVHRDERYA